MTRFPWRAIWLIMFACAILRQPWWVCPVVCAGYYVCQIIEDRYDGDE